MIWCNSLLLLVNCELENILDELKKYRSNNVKLVSNKTCI